MIRRRKRRAVTREGRRYRFDGGRSTALASRRFAASEDRKRSSRDHEKFRPRTGEIDDPDLRYAELHVERKIWGSLRSGILPRGRRNANFSAARSESTLEDATR